MASQTRSRWGFQQPGGQEAVLSHVRRDSTCCRGVPRRAQFRDGVSPLPNCVLGLSTICEKRITVTVSSSADGPRVDLLEEVDCLLAAPELRVVVLDVAGRELGDLLHLDVVDHRGEDLLPGLVAVADRDPDDLAALVLARLVAQPDRGRLPAAAELVDEDRRVEVEDVEGGVHPASLLQARPKQPLTGLLGGLKPSAPISGTNRHGPIVSCRSSPFSRMKATSRSAEPVAIGTTSRPSGGELREQAVRGLRASRRAPRSRRTGPPPGGRGCRPRRSPRRSSTPSSVEPAPRVLAELGHPLDADHAVGELRQDGGRVARAGPDLEHHLIALEAAAPGRSRPPPRAGRSSARGRSAAPSRCRRCSRTRSGHEVLAGHRRHRREHPLVGDPATSQLALHHVGRAAP